nr:lipase member H-B-like [Onthophagus taurus]
MEKYLQKRNCNVIQADWSKLSGLTYVNAIQTSISVGNYIGKFIVRLLDSGLTSHNRIHLIGHSLGAHIAGIAGKETFRLTGKEIGRISGLDPAKQLFEIPSCPDSARLQQTDAELVDITHTDCLLFGFKKPLGTVDFYFNGSRFQPGNRPPNLNVLWNKDDFQEYLFYGHRKSCKYFMDSINNRDIIGWKCKSLENVRRKIYDMTDETIYGENISESAQGIYFVKT